MPGPLYDRIGHGYAAQRKPDPRIAAAIRDALGRAASVLNVGAGAGSYEPTDRRIVGLDPSRRMIEQRTGGIAVQGTALALPFPDKTFDAALAVLTVHHWGNWRAGIAEIDRVARDRIVILTHDPAATCFANFWLLRDYLNELTTIAQAGMPPLADLADAINGRVQELPVPWDCTDGFLSAYWRRPERYLDPRAREAISFFHQVDPALVKRRMARLRSDIESGQWARKNRDLLRSPSIDLGYRLIIGEPGR
ncbi:MAG: SAM-dependent methyltransferase [Chloroflexi bacterium]|nr:MAG: SAM-dependent methyltransferase [Chloroflexota bacterium]